MRQAPLCELLKETLMDLVEFHTEFFQDILASSQASGQLFEDTFFNVYTSILTDIGEMVTADRAHYSGGRGIRVDGYAGDPIDSGTLTVIALDTSQQPSIKKLTKTELTSVFKRALTFIEKTLDPEFGKALEESDPAYGLAHTIQKRWPSDLRDKSDMSRHIEQIRILVLTDKLLSSRIDGVNTTSIRGIPVVHSVWDIERLFNLVASGKEQEMIFADFLGEMGPPIPALHASVGEDGYPTYLLVIPGEQLARIYDRWGTRLLEQNVRVFLQALGSVNKGIRNTLEHEPQMFLAYNNGLAVTAESVHSTYTENGLVVTGIENLQIVNGGQTTASVHAASRRNIDLSNVFVQMKMTLIPPDSTLTVVPRISEYANSQNKVNAADFFSNHPFHVTMEGMSRRLFAPAPVGQFRQTKWFYERARGQYRDAQMKVSGAQRREFDLLFPKSQLFNKTDLAKFEMVWLMEPHIVSRGAQKNFAAFATFIGKEWDSHQDQFGELYYKEAIAKAIVFKATEKLVQSESWYVGGYRANIVAYTLAKISYDLGNRGVTFPFLTVWDSQELSNAMVETIRMTAAEVQESLTSPPSSHSNITEWAKQPACWTQVQSITLDYSTRFLDDCVTAVQRIQQRKDNAADTQILIGIQAQTAVVEKGGSFWLEVLQWAQDSHSISPKEASIVGLCSRLPEKIPTEKQCVVALEVLTRIKKEGFID